jgi:hypothetical protein
MGPKDCIAFLRSLARDIRADGGSEDDARAVSTSLRDARSLEACADEIAAANAFIETQGRQMKAARKLLAGRI